MKNLESMQDNYMTISKKFLMGFRTKSTTISEDNYLPNAQASTLDIRLTDEFIGNNTKTHTVGTHVRVDQDVLSNDIEENAKQITIRFTNIRELLVFFMDRVGIKSTTILHRYIDVTKDVLDDILSGEMIMPRTSALEKIANYFNLTLGQVVGDEDIKIGELQNVNVLTKTVPTVALSDVDEWLHGNKCLVDVLGYIYSNITGFDVFAIRVNDCNLIPDFLPNSNLIIDRSITIGSGKFALLYDSIELVYFLSEIYCLDNNITKFRIAGTSAVKSFERYIKIVGMIVQEVRHIG